MKFKKKSIRFSPRINNFFLKTKINIFSVSSSAARKYKSFKNYIRSENFEEDLDLLIVNLQWFDHNLDVCNTDKLDKVQRINKKIQLIRNSFVKLNAKGIGIGSLLAGPKGAAIASGLVTGSFALLVSKIIYDRVSPNVEHLLLA